MRFRLKKGHTAILAAVGILLMAEGLLIQTDFTQFGIPSIFLFGVQLHHWMIGAAILFLLVIGAILGVI